MLDFIWKYFVTWGLYVTVHTNVPENSLGKEYKMIVFYYEEENLEKQLARVFERDKSNKNMTALYKSFLSHGS